MATVWVLFGYSKKLLFLLSFKTVIEFPSGSMIDIRSRKVVQYDFMVLEHLAPSTRHMYVSYVLHYKFVMEGRGIVYIYSSRGEMLGVLYSKNFMN